MADVKVLKVQSISELARGDVVRHVTSGATCLIDANYGEYAIGITHQHIANPDEWEIVVAGVQHKEQLEASGVCPPGDYIFRIDKVEIRENHREPSSRLIVKCLIVDAESPWLRDRWINRPMANSYQLTVRGWPFLQDLFKACGVECEDVREVEARADALVGREYMATLRTRDHYYNISDERPSPKGGPYR